MRIGLRQAKSLLGRFLEYSWVLAAKTMQFAEEISLEAFV